MFAQIIQKANEIRDAYRNGDWAGAIRLSGELLQLLAGPQTFAATAVSATDRTSLDAVVADLEECCDAPAARGTDAANAAAVNPAAVLAVIQAVVQVIEWFRSRR